MISKFSGFFSQNRGFGGVLSLLKGNIIAKLILTVGSFLLAEKYGPHNFGVFNVFLSYVFILPVVGSLSLDNITTMLTGSKEVYNSFLGTIRVSLLVIIPITLLGLILNSFHLLKAENTVFFIILCGFTGLLTTWNNSQNTLFAKLKLFKQLSFSFIITSLFALIFQILFFILNQDAYGLMYGWIMGLIISLVYGEVIAKARLKKFDLKAFTTSLKRNSSIIKFSYPSESINSLAINILPIIAISYFAVAQIGVYSLAIRILSVPLIILSTSFSKVYFQKAVRLHKVDKQELRRMTKDIVIINLITVSIYVVLVNTVGIFLLDQFFDLSKWVELRFYILILSFWIICRSAVNPISSIVNVIHKNHYEFIFNLYLLFVNFLAIYIGWYHDDFKFCLLIFSACSGFGYLALLFFIFRSLQGNEKLELAQSPT